MAVTQIPGKQIGPLDLTTEVAGILPVANGGTGNTSGGSSATGMLAPVRVATRGDETYTISAGDVTQIAGTTIDDISLAVGDRILVFSAPASTGVGSYGSTTPGNGVYVVTSNTTNLSVVRAADMSGTVKPAGLAVEAAAGTWFHTNLFLVEVPDNPAAAHIYGTDSLRWIINVVPGPATTGTSQTLTNKTIDGASNTLSNVPSTAITGMASGNTSLQSQLVVAGTAYYVTGSNLAVPANLAVGSRFRWTISLVKTAAGTGTFQIRIYRGINGSTSDTADVTQPITTAATAVADAATVEVEIVVTATGATGSYYWAIVPSNRVSATTGFATSSAFSNTVSPVALNTASLKFGLSFINVTGTPTITVPLVRANRYV